MRNAQLQHSAGISPQAGIYIYDIRQLSKGQQVLVSSSDDTVGLYDLKEWGNASHSLTSFHKIKHTGLTTFATDLLDGNQAYWTAGQDGKACQWDLRSQLSSWTVSTLNKAPILSLTTALAENQLITGTELSTDRDPTAAIYVWDIRSPASPLLSYVDSHNDDITELRIQPGASNRLLSAGTDGLVNLFDTKVADEDNAVLQVINHTGSVQHAGFYKDHSSSLRIFAISHDEHLSLYHEEIAEHDDDERPALLPVHFDDVRKRFGCNYVVDVWDEAEGLVVAAGNYSKEVIEIFCMEEDLGWNHNEKKTIRLPGAHGEEVVRAVRLLEDGRILTGGEDGQLKCWSAAVNVSDEAAGVKGDALTAPVKSKVKHRQDKKWSPY